MVREMDGSDSKPIKENYNKATTLKDEENMTDETGKRARELFGSGYY
jgi:hypothetical protein